MSRTGFTKRLMFLSGMIGGLEACGTINKKLYQMEADHVQRF